jgi:integrase
VWLDHATATGGLLDPSNTTTRLRTALDESGFDWVTSHVWRKTVSAAMDRAGMPHEEIASQLGNSVAVLRKHCLPEQRVINPRAVEVLESLLNVDQSRTTDPAEFESREAS